MARHKLRAMRRKKMLNQDDVAHLTGRARGSISDYETGKATPSVNTCRALAKVYEVSFEDLWEALDSNGADELPRFTSGWFSNYEVMEQSAAHISTWEPMLIPGLLQIEDYARALTRNDELVERRMARQAIITRGRDPAELAAIIDESVFLRATGGYDVLAGQLAHLLEMSEHENVTIQVMPIGAPDQAVGLGGKGAFVVLEFPWNGGLVHLEHRGGGLDLSSPHELEAHSEAFGQLEDLALSPADSQALIKHRLGDMKQ